MFHTNSYAVEPRFIGKDRSHVLHHLGARHYSSYLGRFISTDDMKAMSSGYAYTNGNPVMEYDPMGLMPMEPEVAAIANVARPTPQSSDDEHIYEDVIPIKRGSLTAKRLNGTKAKVDAAIIIADRHYPPYPDMFHMDEVVKINKMTKNEIRRLQEDFAEEMARRKQYNELMKRTKRKQLFNNQSSIKVKIDGYKSSMKGRNDAVHRCCEDPAIPALRKMTSKYRESKNYPYVPVYDDSDDE